MLDVRIEKVKTMLNMENLDGFLVINTESFNRATTWYLSGFTGSTAMLLLCPSEQFILTDSRYFIQSREESPFTLKKVAGRDYMGLLEKMLKRRGIKRLGVESDKLTLEQYKQLKSFGVEVVGTTDIFLEMRSIKEDGVMADIRKVCNITATALQNTFAKIEVGITEAQIAAELVHEMRSLGAQSPVRGHFVVASGKRGARPHGVFTDKKIEDGDMVTIDVGAVCNGYVSDVTRTVAVGNVSRKMKDVYQVVHEAIELCLGEIKAGMTGAQADQIARNHIRAAGYGEFFTHGLGHGVGFDLRDMPYLNAGNTEPLKANSIVTVEPGIYIPELGGVRIEDDVMIKEGGCEILTDAATKDLVVL